MTQLTFGLLVVWALLISALPLAPFCTLLPYLALSFSCRCWPPALGFFCHINARSQLWYNQGWHTIVNVDRRVYWWFIKLTLADGSSCFIWRDACRLEDYRALQRWAVLWQADAHDR
ncbi:hypothetical protein HGP28_08045 [Vibrio sp. SM6]|uniref:Uncharacterized protein n=1 Tax=Vibrio agarilyticus TaxID=2726741 RepID=A0A7X8YGS6_9VIBR|nr:hypothetical protein [Vibrio agarilyticus]NLS12850.1 hypothetical protein [Vibrio agarilyticus]